MSVQVNMRPTHCIVEHQSELPKVFCDWLLLKLKNAIRERGTASLALPGGSVAEAFLPAVAGLRLDWSKLEFFWGDERAVPPDNERSNFFLADRLLLTPAAVPKGNVHRMLAEQESLERAAQRYSEMLVRKLGPVPRLDVVLVGVGSDGHICSLFPGHPVLSAEGWVAVLNDAPKPPRMRLTLTLQTLFNARSLALATFGSSKARIVHDVLAASTPEIPAAAALAGAAQSVWFLDADAASSARAAKLIAS